MRRKEASQVRALPHDRVREVIGMSSYLLLLLLLLMMMMMTMLVRRVTVISNNSLCCQLRTEPSAFTRRTVDEQDAAGVNDQHRLPTLRTSSRDTEKTGRRSKCKPRCWSQNSRRPAQPAVRTSVDSTSIQVRNYDHFTDSVFRSYLFCLSVSCLRFIIFITRDCGCGNSFSQICLTVCMQ